MMELSIVWSKKDASVDTCDKVILLPLCGKKKNGSSLTGFKNRIHLRFSFQPTTPVNEREREKKGIGNFQTNRTLNLLNMNSMTSKPTKRLTKKTQHPYPRQSTEV